MTDQRKDEMPDDVADDKLHTLEYALGWAERFVCNEKVKNKDMQIWVEKLREAAIRAASTPSADTIAVPKEVLMGVRDALNAQRQADREHEVEGASAYWCILADKAHELRKSALASLDAVLEVK